MARFQYSEGDRVQYKDNVGTVNYAWVYDAEDDRWEIPYCNVLWDDGKISNIKQRFLIYARSK